MNGGLYFPQWIVIDSGVGDSWFNLSLVVSTLLLLGSAPALGLLSDRGRGRKRFLWLTSLTMFVATLAIDLSNRFVPSPVVRGALALVAFAALLYAYQLSLVFYHVLLAKLATPSEYMRISGNGLAWGWIGGIVGILVVLPFVQGHVPFFQPAGRAQAFLPAALIFALLTVVSLKLMPDEATDPSLAQGQTMRHLYGQLWRDLRNLWSTQRRIAYFLLAYIFYSDAILTVENNSPIYLEKAMGFGDSAKAYLFLELLVGAAVGAIVSRFLSARLGSWRTLFLVVVGWAIVLLLTAAVSSPLVFVVLFGAIGVLYGLVWNCSRVLFLQMVPGDRRAEHFGVYSSFEKFASLVGPLLWSLPIALAPALGPARYRLSMVTMSFLLVVASFVLLRVGRQGQEPLGTSE